MLRPGSKAVAPTPWTCMAGSMHLMYHAAHCDLTFHHMSVRSAGPAALLLGQPWTALMRSFVPPPASVTHPRCRWTSGHAQQAWLPVQHQPAPCTANCLCVHGRYTWIDENAEEAAAVRKRRRAQHMPELLGRRPPVRELHWARSPAAVLMGPRLVAPPSARLAKQPRRSSITAEWVATACMP